MRYQCDCHAVVRVLTRHYSCCDDVTNGRVYPPTQVQRHAQRITNEASKGDMFWVNGVESVARQ